MKTLILALTLLAISPVSRAEDSPRQCDIEQTSAGDYGVRELRASGWVYIVRGLSYERAEAAYAHLVTAGLCQ